MLLCLSLTLVPKVAFEACVSAGAGGLALSLFKRASVCISSRPRALERAGFGSHTASKTQYHISESTTPICDNIKTTKEGGYEAQWFLWPVKKLWSSFKELFAHLGL